MRKLLLGVLLAAILFTAQAEALNLSESIDLAIKQNPTVVAAQKKAAAADAKLKQALSTFFPEVNLNGNLNKAHASPQTVQVNISGVPQTITIGNNDSATISGWQADLSQPLFVSSLFPSYAISQKAAAAADQAYQQQIIDISFYATQAYFGVIRSLKMEKLMGDALTMATAHRKQVQSMLKAGLAKKADLLRSQVREANNNVALIKAKYNIELSKDAFNNALGNNIQKPVDLKDEGFTGKVDNLSPYENLLSTAYNYRPDWKAYLLKIGISQEQVRLSQSEYLPSFLLTADTGNQLTRYPAYQSNVNSWKVMGSGSWKLFDSFGRENRVQEANENLLAQQANVEQIKNNIALEVHDAYLNLKSALDTVVAAKQAVDSAEEGYNVANGLYNAGLGTNVDVLDAQVDLTEAQTNLIDALFGVEITKAQINRAVGKIIF